MRHKIRFFKQRDVETLRKNIRANLPWYRGEDGAVLGGAPETPEEMSKMFDWSCFDALNKNTGQSDDIANTIKVHAAFGELSPQQAADERIWAYATHFGVSEYAAKRWPISEKWDDDKAENHIRRHYFGAGVRGFTRDNAVSRLWWIGHAAARCGDYELPKTLEIILRDQDVRKNLLERSIGMSAEILGGLIRMLGKSLEKSETPDIYKRACFRLFIRGVHRRGGRIMLNMLNSAQLDELLNSMAQQAISEKNA